MTMWKDLRYWRPFAKRYKTTQGKSQKYWQTISRDYYNFKKRVDCTDYHWYVITFKDGHNELAYFRVRRVVFPRGGRLCRGFFLPRYWPPTQYEHTKDIRLAF